MLFWAMPLCFVVFGLIYAVGWFFNADYYHSITRIFWIQLITGLIGNVYLLPILAFSMYSGNKEDLAQIQTLYLIFVLGIIIITFGQALLYYRKTYIMVEKE